MQPFCLRHLKCQAQACFCLPSTASLRQSRCHECGTTVAAQKVEAKTWRQSTHLIRLYCNHTLRQHVCSAEEQQEMGEGGCINTAVYGKLNWAEGDWQPSIQSLKKNNKKKQQTHLILSALVEITNKTFFFLNIKNKKTKAFPAETFKGQLLEYYLCSCFNNWAEDGKVWAHVPSKDRHCALLCCVLHGCESGLNGL